MDVDIRTYEYQYRGAYGQGYRQNDNRRDYYSSKQAVHGLESLLIVKDSARCYRLIAKHYSRKSVKGGGKHTKRFR